MLSAPALGWLRLLGRVLGVGLALIAAAVLAAVLAIRHYELNLPDVRDLRTHYRPAQVTRVLARDGTVLASLFVERRTVIPFAEIPNHTKLSFLAAEDATFYEHEGLDYFGMLRALTTNLRAGRTKQGASTITQQVVKNVLLDPERTYTRKIKETILARRLEHELGKDEIFSLYLNQIYLGHGRFGIEEAARYYFGKKAKDLDVAESALLAGLVASPERFSPRHDASRALVRRHYVLGQMLEKHFITPELHAYAEAQPVRLAPATDDESELAPEVVDRAKLVLESVAGSAASRGGFVIETSLDPVLQAAARRAVRDNLDAYRTRQKLEAPFTQATRKLWGPLSIGKPKQNRIYVGRVVGADDGANTIDVRVGDALGRIWLEKEQRYNPKRLPASQFAKLGAALRVSLQSAPDGPEPLTLRLELGPESALLAIDVRTREIRALVGSYEAMMGGLDRASYARRQPGSAFKPLVYSYALHSRLLTPASVLELANKPGKLPPTYRISVRSAIAASDNNGAQKILEQVGAANVIEWARALGITEPLQPTPSLALGAYELTALELANAFATFANGGVYASPRLISRVTAPGGKTLPLPELPPERRVLTPEEAYLTTSLLRSVIEKGTAERARSLNRPLAGKTGTTNLAKDTWFCGYSTELVTVVWVGYDDALPLGWGEAGAVTALPAWISFMKVAHDKHPPTDFPRPVGIVTASIDPATGLLSYPGQENALEEEFLDGTVPSEQASPDAGTPDAGPHSDDEARLGKLPSDAGAADSGNEVGLPTVEPPPF